ncbi:MAG: TonB-dependent receptor, partial [Actinomycetota bacterium]
MRELQFGTLTQASGRFVLLNVPAGTHTLQVELIGYRSASEEVTVTAGEAVEVNLQIVQEALALGEIVVTGTAGGEQRRVVGNVVGQIDVSGVSELSPASDLQQLIGQREAGVTFTNPAGMVGAGGNIRVRGVSSPALGNEPIIYVDGVRINNQRTGANVRGGRHHRPLNDYNMEDIESIEIIKGPAAATLYGTEASNGVIQIITKKGVQGAPTFDLMVRQGASAYLDPRSLVRDIAGRDPATGDFVTINLYDLEKAAGRDPFRTGYMQTYMGSIRGGSDAIRYYMSAEWQDNEGVELSNWQERLNTRLNLAANLSETFSVQTNVAYGKIDTRYGAQALSTWGQMVWGSPENLSDARRGYFSVPPDVAERVEAMGDHARFVSSLQADYNPWDWLSQRLTVGLQEDRDINSSFTPLQPAGGDPPGGFRFFGNNANGNKQVDLFNTRNTTVDYAGTARAWLADELESSTSFGAQYYSRERHETSAEGEGFPSPSVSTVSAAARVQGGESLVANKTVGFYLQQTLDWKERRVLTAAVRADNNSAFGAEFDAAIYPKVSGTWVLHEEPFWNVGFVNALRLRGAWGASGQQPDVFAAVRLYDAITGPGDRPAVSPGTLGNPSLKPERGEEVELGFDAAFFDERLDVEFTHYRRTTTDLIVPRRVAPSRGFPGTQFVNVGEVRNWGTEFAVEGLLRESASFSWDLGVTYATQHSRIEDLGGLEISPIHQEGWPLGGIFWQRVVSAEFGPDGVTPTNLMCDGGTGKQGLEQGGPPVPCDDAPRVWFGQRTPSWLGNVHTTLRFGDNLRLFAMADFTGGHHTTEGELLAGHTTFTNTPEVNPITDPV